MLSKKALALKPSPTLAIAAKAKELSAHHHVISLSVGEPDWDTFAPIKEAGQNAIQAGQTKYSPAAGTPQLRTAIAHATEKLLGIKYDPSAVTVSAGAKFILYGALKMLLDPGDEVLIPAPYWVSYPTMVELNDGVPVIVTTTERTGFKAQVSDLEAKITPRTKVLLINSPSNPSGQMYTRAELQELAEMLRRHPRIFLISDDIYNQLVFEGDAVAPHILHVASDLRERVLVVNGASKSYAMTGWRIGWALGPKALITAMSNYQSQTVSCAATFTQSATLAALQNCAADIESAVKKLRGRRDLFVEALNAVPGWRADYPQGAFYVWADIRALLGKSWQGRKLETSSNVAEALLEARFVAVVPGGESGIEGYLRLSFALHETELNEAVKRIHAFTEALI